MTFFALVNYDNLKPVSDKSSETSKQIQQSRRNTKANKSIPGQAPVIRTGNKETAAAAGSVMGTIV